MIKGVIFDMDGVITDNNPYHKKAWDKFSEQYGVRLTSDEVNNYIFGRVARDTVEYIFKKKLTQEEIDDYVEQKENIYKKIYEAHIKPVDGLIAFLEVLTLNKFKLAMATSAPRGNVNFTFRHIPIKHFFDVILDEDSIINGKPHPEIYIKAIKMLGLVPEQCLIFEDSLPGIAAAKGSGAFVIGVSTTHDEAELSGVHKVIRDFNQVNINDLKKMTE